MRKTAVILLETGCDHDSILKFLIIPLSETEVSVPHTSRWHTHAPHQSSARLWINRQTSQDHLTTPYVRHSHTCTLTLRSNVTSFAHFNTDQSGALSMPGHRCPLAASPGRRSQKQSEKKNVCSVCTAHTDRGQHKPVHGGKPQPE